MKSIKNNKGHVENSLLIPLRNVFSWCNQITQDQNHKREFFP